MADFDQHDPKAFKETLGTFGTTTKPGGNQLQELQTKVRQGVKHVELHLAGAGKGQFNVQDVPDKYGFEQRRTIMQLAKLNDQTLSIHGTFDINSFSGLSQRGFNEQQRANNIKEIDETLKFAAETAKQGAVVFHLHETQMPTPPGELNLPDNYVKWLKENRPDEYKEIRKKHLNKDELERQFVDNPDLEAELKVKYNNLSDDEKKRYSDNLGINSWKDYYQYNKDEQIKLEQDGTPLVLVGDSITRTQRDRDLIDVKGLGTLTAHEKEVLRKEGIVVDPKQLTIDDFQRIQAKFTNGKPSDMNSEDFRNIRSKLIVDYIDVLNKNDRMKSKADKEFFEKSLDMQVKLAELQKEDLDLNRKRYSQYLDEIEEIKRKERDLTRELNEVTRAGNKEREQEILRELNGGLSEEEQREMADITQRAQAAGGRLANDDDARRYQEITANSGGLQRRKYELEVQEVGQIAYQKLDRYDEMTAQLNEQIKKAKEQKENSKVLTDEIFEKNSSSMGHLGLKALRYQLDLKTKSKQQGKRMEDFDKEINAKEKKFNESTNQDERSKLNAEIQKLKYDRRLWVGTKDYEDIDVINKPLYLAPENIMAGYGYMDSLEEYKGVIRTSWDEFAKKLLSDEESYKQIRKDYEKETGKKVTNYKDAYEIAKRHIGGTFDNAHAGVWLKYFKREAGESEEHRIERFNKWLNKEAEDMAKEGIIKHVHFNDTQGKDDDHNLLGSGLLDIHDMRERLRGAGIKEALIVEAGGRGADSIMHMMNAFDIFNPQLHAAERAERGYAPSGTSSVSDWVNVKREYENRPQYSQYGMSYNSFSGQAKPQQGRESGGWSGTSFF